MRHIVRANPIVVVDDDASSVQVLTAMLAMSGHQAITVPLGSSAAVARHLLDLNPALAFIDLTLGRADGRDIVRQLREAGSSSYLVACTGWGGDDDIRGALAAGFDEHWLKPLEWSRMRAWLEAHVPVE